MMTIDRRQSRAAAQTRPAVDQPAAAQTRRLEDLDDAAFDQFMKQLLADMSDQHFNVITSMAVVHHPMRWLA